jgi:hypothetical protein
MVAIDSTARSWLNSFLMISLAAVITDRKKVDLHSDCKSAITLVKQRMQLRSMTKHAAFNLLRICANTDACDRLHWVKSHPERLKTLFKQIGQLISGGS